MRRAAFRALLSHWRRRPWQLLTLILGLSLATGLWTGVQAINSEARAGYDRAGELARLMSLPVLQRTDGTALAIADFAALRRAGWPVTPILTARLGRLQLTGIDPFTHPLAGRLGPGSAGGGRGWIGAQAGLFAEPATAARMGEGTGEGTGLPQVIATSGLPPGQAFGDIGLVARLAGRPDALDALALTAEPPGPTPDGFRISEAPRIADLRGLTDSFHLNLTAFGFLAFAVGLFIFHAGTGLAVEQRRATFRTLRAIGLPLSTLAGLLALELLAIAAVAGMLGLGLGYGVAAALLPDVGASLRGLYGATGVGTLTLRPDWIAAGLGLAFLGAGIAGAGALFTVRNMPLLASALPRAWSRESARNAPGLALAGTALIAAGAAAGVLDLGLAGAFALLGGLLLGAALILPLLLGSLFRVLEATARRPLARWFWADSALQLPGLRLALMALMLALAANLGVNTMVASFRTTFLGFLDQRLVSELTVTARDEAEARALARWLEPRAQAVLPIWHADLTLADRPAELFGIADDPAYRASWPMLSATPDAWAALAKGTGAFVSEQLARRAGLALGDPLTLAPGWTLTIAAIYADYGNPAGQVVVPVESLTTHFPDIPKLRFGIRTHPGTSGALRLALTQDFGLPASSVSDRETVRRFSLQVFDRTFAVTAALNVLTLGVAGFAILTSLLTLSAIRLPQLAPVWAIGLTGRRLAGLEVLRALMLAGVTFAAALPVGLALAWTLLTVVNAEAFGWRLPMQLFPGSWARLLGLALIAGTLSAAWPALRLARLSPARLTQVFAHER